MSETATELLVTPLHALHNELGAKMVPFAGYSMPVQYPAGVKTEHLHTRKEAGLFDVSHMGQLTVSGEGIVDALEKLLPIDIGALDINQQSYALLTNEDGGILDDLIITRWTEDTFFIVVNAACKEQDIAHFRKHLPNATIEVLSSRALLALQGPSAKDVVEVITPVACELTFMRGCVVTIHLDDTAVECYVTRSGYTGEDGFEISIPNEHADAVARLLLSFECVEAIGLGARDSLRLEAGLCLYGHDMNTETNPIDASLLWSISKSRRPGGVKAGGFFGTKNVFAAIEKGSERKRVGLFIDGRAPVREGAVLVDANDNTVGIVTSGGFGPSINKPIAIGYANKSVAALGTGLFALVRGKKLPVIVSRMPFVEQRYHRG
ncbi:MAG: aminomethyltransferase [Candidatus Endobugula sp.]|jgi:aminomethyltransferase